MNKIMAKQNLKLISARIEPKTLDQIDAWLRHHIYWKRNTLINGVLTAVFNTFSEKEIYDMARYSPHFFEKPSGSFSLPKKISKNRA